MLSTIQKRNGQTVPFNRDNIETAIKKAAISISAKTDTSFVVPLTNELICQLEQLYDTDIPTVENIQDHVEKKLMETGFHEIAKAYILYREKQKEQREKEQKTLLKKMDKHQVNVVKRDGSIVPFDTDALAEAIERAIVGYEHIINATEIAELTKQNLFEGVTTDDIDKAVVMVMKARIEKDPAYSYATAQVFMNKIYKEVFGPYNSSPFKKSSSLLLPSFKGELSERSVAESQTEGVRGDVPTSVGTEGSLPSFDIAYRTAFKTNLQLAADNELVNPKLLEFDLDKMANALLPENDRLFTYLGIQTLYDRYFIHLNKRRIEAPQTLWMRVAMGLALNETNKEEKAIEFYNLYSNLLYVSSTPTLFNSGTLHSQLSSCYLSTVEDDLGHIFKVIGDDAQLSKFAGGLGNDWTNVRATGARIKGTNGESQGVIPFLKIANDTAVAVNQCFHPTTLIHTGRGIREIQDTKKGDLVLGISGAYREVTETMQYDQKDDMVELNIKHSINKLSVSSGHPFYAIQNVPLEQGNTRTMEWLQKGKIKPEWVDAKALSKGDMVAQIIPEEIIPVKNFTEEDARLYGILLGDGHCSKKGFQWGVSGNPSKDNHLEFVRQYLKSKDIHFWETGRGKNYLQIHWSSGRGAVHDKTTGRITGPGEPTMPFTMEDLYNEKHQKRVHKRFSHLPPNQTLALIKGLLETDGGVSRGKEIYFTSTSQELAEGIRYQCLRLKIPTSGQYRERINKHTGNREDGTKVIFSGTTACYDVRIPAVAEIANLVNCKPIRKRNWLIYEGGVFSRIRSINPATACPTVFDLKVEGDESYMTTSALVHNGGKRKGAMCAYLETWHLDIEEFLELRKNTGDERRRTHDMNTANWIPDLFMQRVKADADWTLFSPNETPELHHLYGHAFKEKYEYYESLTTKPQVPNSEFQVTSSQSTITVHKTVKARDLWRKMITMLFETGHPWITFKDPCNIRSPQDHTGVVHNSNLCTEITLNTSAEETAVCNLGSVNLGRHVVNGKFDINLVKKTVATAMRMLDNVIDINFYPTKEAENSNKKHRPVGLGVMGLHDALYRLDIAFESEEGVRFSNDMMEAVSHAAILGSTELAKERGTYQTYKGSKWDRDILPLDTLDLLETERGETITTDRLTKLDWEEVRTAIKTHGMRNSNCMAIAPTATISNIAGCVPCIEPIYKNLYVKSNLSGEFTIINPYLIEDLKKQNLWDEDMSEELKYYDGSVQQIHRVPPDLKAKYKEVFEIDPFWLVKHAAVRSKWIDQSQSVNVFMRGTSGKTLNDIYFAAWESGMKTTYYLRSLGASQVEKSTTNASKYGTTHIRSSVIARSEATKQSPSQTLQPQATPLSQKAKDEAIICSILNGPDCEACQ